MAAPYNPPKKNEDFLIRIALEDYASPGNLKSSPTIAAGDFKVAVDATALANLGTLPTRQPLEHGAGAHHPVGGRDEWRRDHPASASTRPPPRSGQTS